MIEKGHRLFAAGYDRLVGPAERGWLGARRGRLLSGLTGDVLDVGAGTGAGLSHYRAAARIVAAEPDPAMRAKLAGKTAAAPAPVEISDAAAESLPYPDTSFDAVVFVLTLCTVADPEHALAEAGRVLRPTGRLVILEHVRGEGRLARWQDRLAPVWSRVAAGCQPNRDTLAAVERAGFAFERVEAFRSPPNWFITSPMLEAVAVRPS
jgi:ubiquinone/menaquinone biosynthesis C-methylase UbiE